MADQKTVAATVASTPNHSSSNVSKTETVVKIIPGRTPLTSPAPPLARARSTPSGWTGSEDGIPIPSALKNSDSSHPIARQDSQRAAFTAPNSWKTVQTPLSWGGGSVLFNDEGSLYGGDDQSDRGTDSSVAGLSYARKRRLLRHLSKSSGPGTTSRRGRGSRSVKVKWTKKLEDFREYGGGIFKSLLPLKAAVGASLAACLGFAPFVPEFMRLYGVVAVVGVGMSLDSNVGLTMQKGANLMLGSFLAGACASLVTLVEPFTGDFKVYYVITCVFLGGYLPRLISLPAVKTSWAQTLTYYISVFHGLILNERIKMQIAQLFLSFFLLSTGFMIGLFVTLCVRPDYAGDSLLVLLVSDFHTAGVVLERIVEDYGTGTVLTKIQEVLSGVVTEDHIHHDLQYIMKSKQEADKLMGAVRWEPAHGKFFHGYPWDLYLTLLAMLQQSMHDLIALDSALRAEIQAPVEIRRLFAEDMDIVARECSMLFHKVGDALFEHKKIDYHSNVQQAKLATLNLRKKLVNLSTSVIAQDAGLCPSSSLVTRNPSHNSVSEVLEELPTQMNSVSEVLEDLPTQMSPVPTPPPSPPSVDRVIQQDLETSQKLNMDEEDWKARLFERRHSVCEHWEETQQQICSLSFIKFATILIEFMSKVETVVTMVDQISVKACFSELS